MFRNERQRSAVAYVLLDSLQLGKLWTVEGPTEAACTLLKKRGGSLSSGERLILLAAFDLWNGDGHADFSELLYRLDDTRLHLLGSFLVAFASGSSGVDRWLAKHLRTDPNATPASEAQA